MHNVVRLPEQRHLGPDQLATEMEALAAAREVAARIAQSSAGGSNAAPSRRLMEWVAQAGLLGISIPDEFGGPEMANAAIADIVAILAEADLIVGESVRDHYRVLEALRLGGSHEQKNVFFTHARAGEHFCLAISNDSLDESAVDTVRLTSDRTGYQLSGEVAWFADSSPDWVVTAARDPTARTLLVFLDRTSQNLVAPKPRIDAGHSRYPTALLDKMHVPIGSVIPVHVAPSVSHSTLQSLDLILDAAVNLGLAKSVFGEVCRHLSDNTPASASADAMNLACSLHQRVGRLSARIEGASAAIERAGQHLDMAQVDMSAQSAQHACLSASAATVLASDLALDVMAAFIEVVNPPSTYAARQSRRLLVNDGLTPQSLAHLVHQALSAR